MTVLIVITLIFAAIGFAAVVNFVLMHLLCPDLKNKRIFTVIPCRGECVDLEMNVRFYKSGALCCKRNGIVILDCGMDEDSARCAKVLSDLTLLPFYAKIEQ